MRRADVGGDKRPMAHRMLAPGRSFTRCRRTGFGLTVGVVLGLGLYAAPVEAHIALQSPPARYSQDYQKNAPCGHPDNPPGEDPPTVFQAGETITLEIDEFVGHNGHLRVALDPTGTDDFTLPMDFDDLYNAPNVLVDDIADPPGGDFKMIEVTLPDEPCDPCVLQVIQVMYDGEFGPGVSDLYFQCADVVLEGVAATGGTTTTEGDTEVGSADETTEAGTTTGDPGTTTIEPGSDSGPGDPDPDPATGDPMATGGGATTGSMPGGSGDGDGGGGCGCRADRSSPGAWSWLLLVPLVWRRRG